MYAFTTAYRSIDNSTVPYFSLYRTFVNVEKCFRPSDFDYNDELSRNGFMVSGLFVAPTTTCQADSRQISPYSTPIIYAEPIDS